jgi:hypothetical protein
MTSWTDRARAATAQMGHCSTAKTDETGVSMILAVSAVRSMGITDSKNKFSSVLAVPPPVEIEKPEFASTLTEDPDRWCWPHSIAMSGSEIEKFTARLERFDYFGIDGGVAEKLADRLVMRDREDDDRSLCLECAHLRLLFSCVNSLNAGISTQHSDSKLPSDFVIQLQRCPGFKPRIG